MGQLRPPKPSVLAWIKKTVFSNIFLFGLGYPYAKFQNNLVIFYQSIICFKLANYNPLNPLF